MPQITFDIEEDFYQELVDALEPKGLTAEKAARLYLKSLARASARSKVLCLDDKMPFGQYEGEELHTLVGLEPRYLNWCIHNIPKFFLDTEVLEALAKEEAGPALSVVADAADEIEPKPRPSFGPWIKIPRIFMREG